MYMSTAAALLYIPLWRQRLSHHCSTAFCTEAGSTLRFEGRNTDNVRNEQSSYCLLANDSGCLGRVYDLPAKQIAIRTTSTVSASVNCTHQMLN